MEFYDGMYDAGIDDDPLDYMDALEAQAMDYLDSRSSSRYEEPEDEGAIGPPYYIDYLASAFHKKTKHLIEARYFPKVYTLLDGHKYVIMCVSGTNEETGDSYHTEYWPFFEATEEDLSNLPSSVDDFIIRFRMQDRRDIETYEEYLECFAPITWLSYSKSVEEGDIILSGGKCKIQFKWDDEYYRYSHSQNYLLFRLNSKITKEDKQNTWTDEYGCTYNRDKTKLIKCNRELKEYAIRPGTLCICDEAFRYCRSLESLTIPPSVVIIGTWVFELCNQLKQLTIPNSILKIGSFAFHRCENLEEIVFVDATDNDKKRVDFPDYLFDSCKKLRRVQIPNYARSIGSRVFYNCKELESVKIPNGVERLGSSAFCHCESLQEVQIPESVKYVDSGCFECCYNLKEISFPDSITYFGCGILRYCSGIQKVKLPKGITEIPQDTFDGCSSLESFCIPESVESIGGSAFSCCKNLVRISIPDSVKCIGSNSFFMCEKLSEVKLPNSLTTIESSVFRNCYSLVSINIPPTVSIIEEEAFGLCKSLEEINIPDSVDKIDTAAFFDCISLKKIHLPSSLSWLSTLVFDECSSLQEIYLPKDAEVFGEFLKGCTSLRKVIIPNGCNFNKYAPYIPEGIVIIQE